MGESLVKMQQKTSLPTEVTSSKIIEETTTRSTLDSAKVFGRKFSASLDNFASLSLRESRVVEEGEEEVGDSETFRACNKRKREETPLQEVSISLSLKTLSVFFQELKRFLNFHWKSHFSGIPAAPGLWRSGQAGLGGCHCR